MPPITIKVATDFSRYPGGRFKESSDYSGEEFREKLIEPHLIGTTEFVIDLNNLFAIPPSFLDESLGKVIEMIGIDQYKKRFTVLLDDDDDAKRELADIIRIRSTKSNQSGKK